MVLAPSSKRINIDGIGPGTEDENFVSVHSEQNKIRVIDKFLSTPEHFFDDPINLQVWQEK